MEIGCYFIGVVGEVFVGFLSIEGVDEGGGGVPGVGDALDVHGWEDSKCLKSK